MREAMGARFAVGVPVEVQVAVPVAVVVAVPVAVVVAKGVREGVAGDRSRRDR